MNEQDKPTIQLPDEVFDALVKWIHGNGTTARDWLRNTNVRFAPMNKSNLVFEKRETK